MQNYIAETEIGSCVTSEYAVNGHCSVTGVTGSGKTVHLNRMELEAAKRRATVIIIDVNQSHADSMIFPSFKTKYGLFSNRIDAKLDGLNLEFLKPLRGNDGRMEDMINLINSATYALGSSSKMGIRQMGALREAVIFALKNRSAFPDEMDAVKYGLLQQDDPVAKGVYEKLWTVINSKILRSGVKHLKKGAINIISFYGMDKGTQAAFVEILLSTLWRTVQYQGEILGGDILLVIDEYQNLPLKEGAVLRDILREGRKFGLNLFLATQSLRVFPRDIRGLINQAGTRLYFKPPVDEIRSIAREIDSKDTERWTRVLSSLRVGEAVAIGSFVVGGREIDHPIIVR